MAESIALISTVVLRLKSLPSRQEQSESISYVRVFSPSCNRIYHGVHDKTVLSIEVVPRVKIPRQL